MFIIITSKIHIYKIRDFVTSNLFMQLIILEKYEMSKIWQKFCGGVVQYQILVRYVGHFIPHYWLLYQLICTLGQSVTRLRACMLHSPSLRLSTISSCKQMLLKSRIEIFYTNNIYTKHSIPIKQFSHCKYFILTICNPQTIYLQSANNILAIRKQYT